MSYAHIVDSDYRRRAQVARQLLSRAVHAEIYESVAEFRDAAPTNGFVLCEHGAGRQILESGERSVLQLPLLVYSDAPCTADIVEAVRLGAFDFFDWPVAPLRLDRSLHRLAVEGDQRLAERNLQADARTKIARLTARETDVLLRLVQGGSNRAIAEDLGISPRTVEIHRANLLRKLPAQSVAEAVRLAIHAGIEKESDFTA